MCWSGTHFGYAVGGFFAVLSALFLGFFVTNTFITHSYTSSSTTAMSTVRVELLQLVMLVVNALFASPLRHVIFTAPVFHSFVFALLSGCITYLRIKWIPHYHRVWQVVYTSQSALLCF